MRAAATLLALLYVASCASVPVLSTTEDSDLSHSERVQLDVQAIAQGMNLARAQSGAVARARAP